MEPFDERMKARARAEQTPVPPGFETRLQAGLEALPERRSGRSPRALRRGLIAAAVAAALCAGGVVAAPTVLKMAGIELPAGFGTLAGQVEYQPYSSAVGASATDRGYTLSVDAIGLDDAFVTLYCTITGEDPIPRQGNGEPSLWSLKLRAQGKNLEFWGQDLETEWVDEYTLRLVQRSPVLTSLPDVVELQIYSNELFYSLPGDWSLALTVDKSDPAAQSLIAEPNQSFTMDGHKVTADKVVVAPSGGGLVLTEAGDGPPLERFVLRDDLGNTLPCKRYGTVSRPLLPVSNFIEFYGGRTDMTSLTLIPWQADGASHEVKGGLDALPLTDEWADNGYTLLSLDVGETEASAVFRSAGILGESDVYSPEFTLLDADGARVELGDSYLERERDVETGLWTLTLSYPDAAAEQVAEIAGVSFWQPNCTLLEEQAVTIPLS